MASHQIRVTVGASSIEVRPDSLSMTTADDVAWSGTTGGAFTILFDDDGPFGQRHLSHGQAKSSNRPRKRGRFKYTVISAENPNVKLDPDIVVGDPPTDKP